MHKNIKVSVVVPIYNVEEYLEECLDSLVNQTLKEIEIIMVNDGSTDRSGDIAKRYSEKYSNFIYIEKENGGLGHARNYAIPYVKGEYMIFIDSDDYVSIDAYEKMYIRAEETKSDVVIGNVKRFNSKGSFASGLHKKVFKEDVLVTHILERPELVYDTTSWNKLFKMSFWMENEFKFPENILYEDIPVTVPAHFKAKRISILKDIIYYWRVRDGLSKSITQNRTQIKNFKDRLQIMKMTDEFYNKYVLDEKSIFYRDFKWLDMDLKLYINEIGSADNQYIKELVCDIKEYIKSIDKTVFDNLRAIDKMKYYLIEEERIKELQELIEYEKHEMKFLKVYKRNRDYYGEFPFSKIPKSYFKMTKELELCKEFKKIEKLSWKRNIMKIEGYMYIPRVNISKESDRQVKIKLVNIETNKFVNLDYNNIKRQDITQKAGIKIENKKLNSRLYNYNWSGFEINIDFNKEEILNLGDGKYKILVEYLIDGIKKEFYLGEPLSGKRTRPLPKLNNFNKVITQYNLAYELIISIEKQSAGIIDISLEGENVLLKAWGLPTTKISCIDWENNINKTPKIEVINFDIDKRIKERLNNVCAYQITIPINEFKMNYNNQQWYLYYYNNGKREPLTISYLRNSIYHVFDKKLLKINISPAGTLMLNYDNMRTFIERTDWTDNALSVNTIIGEKFFENNVKNAEIIFRGEQTNKTIVVKSISSEKRNGLYKCKFILDLSNNKNYEEFITDIWIATINYNCDNRSYSHMILSECVNHHKYKDVIKHRFRTLTTKKGYLALKVDSKWSWVSKGPKRRELIAKYIYPILRKLPIRKNKIVFEGWWGDKYHCNPKYLYEYIDENYPKYKCIWSVNDENIKVNGSAKKVKRGGLRYYYHMATSKYFVNNVNFEDSYEKRNGAVEIQTMHGTPLKTLGLDVPDELPTQNHVDRFLRRCGRWDYLVVQSDTAERITKSCYRYGEKYLKTGYPRNDILFEKNNVNEIINIKEKLGIDKNKKVILYAPTWRIKNKFDMMIDIEKMKKSLGEEYIFALRIHPFALKGLDKSVLNEFVINVSDYKSVEELYLISDVLITDYSSVMFDYAILNKPILFFTYDLQLYRDNLRGFNVNLLKEAPGPLIYNSDQLLRTIKNIDDTEIRYKKRYEKFKNKFCKYETGKACANIFKEVFE
ncbi:MAG: bifunctional glycosyltransferase/CDP-glycerol:glycerophosphate glycerophosphotransferase [Clostridium sp.]